MNRPAACENQMATGNQGKSGSARVIDFIATAEIIRLLMAYPKSRKKLLTAADKAALGTFTAPLKAEVYHGLF